MEFQAALTTAIAAHGSSLGELSEALRELGTPVSTSALSTWQTGASRPERRASLEALSNLEQILDLPEGTLRKTLPARRPRGRRTQHNGHHADNSELWQQADSVDRLLAKLNATAADLAKPVRLLQRIQLWVDHNGEERELRVTRILRAGAKVTDRMLFLSRYHSLNQPPRITHANGCRLGRFRADVNANLTLLEFVLDQPLAPGQATIVEFGLRYPTGQADRCTDFRVRPGTGQFALEVYFDPAGPPSGWQTFFQPQVTAPATVIAEHNGGTAPVVARYVGIDPAPGIYGVRWTTA